MTTVKPEYLDVLELLDSWQFESQPHIEDPGVSEPSPGFYKTTKKIVLWCDQHRIDGNILWEVYRQIRAYGHPDRTGYVGPCRSAETMRTTYRKAIDLRNRIFNLAVADQEEIGKEGENKVGAPKLNDEAQLSPAELAEHFGVKSEALRKRLERLRRTNLDCFTEVSDRKSREPQYLYRVGIVRSVIEDMKKKDPAKPSSERLA